MKKFIFVFIFLVCSIVSFSQQSITLCEEANNTFNYLTSSGQPGNYTWLIDGSVTNDSDSSITIDWEKYALGLHIISVTFYTVDGCESPTISYEVNLLECVKTTMYAPNAFTPNNDGLNNVWLPLGYNFKSVEFTVYDRWGLKIFESQDALFGWDGTYDGKQCPQDVYVYKIKWVDYQNKTNTQYGHITLFR